MAARRFDVRWWAGMAVAGPGTRGRLGRDRFEWIPKAGLVRAAPRISVSADFPDRRGTERAPHPLAERNTAAASRDRAVGMPEGRRARGSAGGTRNHVAVTRNHAAGKCCVAARVL